MKTSKPRAGIVLASHTREPTSFSLGLLNKGIKAMGDGDIEIIFNGKAAVDDRGIRDAIKELKDKDVDLYIIVAGNWIEPPVLSHPLEEIRGQNILLLGFPESMEMIKEGHFLGSNSAFTVLRNSMKQMDFRFRDIQKFPYREDAVREIKDFAHASRASREMRRVKMGLIGYCSMGIYTTCFDQLKIRSVFGVEIDSYADSYLLYDQMMKVEEKRTGPVLEELKKRCQIDEQVVKNGSLDKSLKMYLALKDMAEERDWKGVTVKCQHEYSTFLKCTACLPLSLLTDDGLMCTDEGDVHALVTMIAMNELSGKSEPLYFGDIYKLEEGGFLMGHCGLSPHSCAADSSGINLFPQSPRISLDGRTTGGVISNYMFREGPVTIGRIENDRQGSYYFHFTRGNIKAIEPLANRWSSLVFTPDSGQEAFADNQLANHYIFIYDDIEDRVRDFCFINGLKVLE